MNILQKGENISLTKLIPDLQNIIILIKWQTPNETLLAIESSAFLLTTKNKVRSNADFIFHEQPTAVDNSVLLKNNAFKVAIHQMNNEIDKISLVLSIADSKNFSLLKNITIELFNFSDKQKILSYTLTDATVENVLIMGLIYRYNNEWRFRVLGQGYTSGLIRQGYTSGLIRVSQLFGVKVNQTQKTDTTTSQFKKIPKNTTNLSKLENKQQPQDIAQNTIKSSNKKSDIHNTDMMTKQNHYTPIVQWFETKNCRAVVNETATDTRGFFDEVAVMLGDDYDVLKIVSDTIKRKRLKGIAYINLRNYNQNDAELIKKFCKALYDYTFVARYFFDKKNKRVILNLQSATKIVNFFNGEWLEWYAMMKIAESCHENNIAFSCIRNMQVFVGYENTAYEIDVFFLIKGKPLFIECKSGEYRNFIDKYSKLRKKLSIEKPYFLMLLSGVTVEHTDGLNAMFDITFVNEALLLNYVIEQCVRKKPKIIHDCKTKAEINPNNTKIKEPVAKKQEQNNQTTLNTTLLNETAQKTKPNTTIKPTYNRIIKHTKPNKKSFHSGCLYWF